MTKNEIAKNETSGSLAIPAHLQGGRTTKVGNIDTSDLIVPRIKLLQAISPEVAELKLPGAEAGVFWHTVAQQSLGTTLRATPILFRKSQVLWSPRNDDRGVLARSSDAVHWDPGFENQEFTVKPKGSPHNIVYKTLGNVAESGLAEFGSSVPGDNNSPPALALTYSMMWFMHDFPDMSPAIIINTRSSIKPAKMLISNLDMSPVDHYGRVFEIGTTDERGDEGPYKGYAYRGAGYIEDADLFAKLKSMYDFWNKQDWKANDEGAGDEASAAAAGGAGAKPAGNANSSKF